MRHSKLKIAAALAGAVVLILAGVLLFLRGGSLMGSDGEGEGLRCFMGFDGPPSEREDWGPYSFYPISFPKVLGALLYFEEHRPALGATKSQCVAMIPVLEEMSTSWAEAIRLNEEMKRVLTPAQVRFVMDNKSELERPVNMIQIQEKLAGLLGEKDHRAPIAVQDFCRKRAEEGPHDPDYPRSAGTEIITAFDISSGVILMEVEGDPELHLTPYQGGKLAPLFERYFNHNHVVQGLFCDPLLGLFSVEQGEGLKENIKEVISYKKLIFETDDGTVYRDPLFDRVIRLCRSKL